LRDSYTAKDAWPELRVAFIDFSTNRMLPELEPLDLLALFSRTSRPPETQPGEWYGLQAVQKWLSIIWVLQASEKGIVLKGHDFSRADKGNKIDGL
jgi:hypothetical protein